MRIDFWCEGQTGFVQLKGELDHHSAEKTRETLNQHLNFPGIKRMVIDMKELTFMDSSGIGVLLGRYKEAKRSKIKLYVKNVPPQVRRVMQVAGIFSIIDEMA